jgi:aspartate/glutamate racemase
MAMMGEDMKVIGMLGGMSWESTQTYYALLTLLVQQADTDISLFDTTAIHAAYALDCALGKRRIC